MDILSALNNVIDYIEANIYEDLKISQLSKIAIMNEYELSNLFHSLTGMTIKEYIRKRRLTLAADELQKTDLRIIDIAVKYRYDSADSFRRAFSQQHGISPKEARNNNQQIQLYPPVSFQIKVEGVNKMNFKIVDVDEMSVFGVSEVCYSSDEKRYDFARTMWDEKLDNIPKQIADGYDGIWYGIWSSNSYAIARNISNCKNNNLEEFKIPKSRYAVFTTEKGGYAGNELPKLHNDIFNSWLPSSKYEPAFNMEIEVFHLATDRATRRKNRYYEIWIPIKDKSNSDRKNDITVREAELSDASSISLICNESLGYSCKSELVEEKLGNLLPNREKVYVATIDNTVVGFAHVEKYEVLYCDSMANLLGLSVLSEHQGKGVGKALVKQVEDWARKINATSIRLNSGMERKEAHNFYRHMGYDNEKLQTRFIKRL